MEDLLQAEFSPQGEEQIIVKTCNLTKSFGPKIAANSVNITIRKGDIYGFIGKNGAGKTTVMRMILGTLYPTSGSVELFGGQPLSQARRKIGSLLETPGFYRNCSAKENLKRMSILTDSSNENFDELLNLVGLGDVGNKKAGSFSLGMKQRLGIAIALLGNPQLMILDEPINGLDPEGIKAIRDLVLMLNRERGITFLISSHLLDELAKIVTHYGIINDGNLIEEVRADELQRRTFDGVRLTVSDASKAMPVLEKFASAENIRQNGNSIMMRGTYDNTAKINSALIAAGVEVSELALHSGGLEEYFIERIGR